MKNKEKTQVLIFIGLLVSFGILLSEFASIEIPPGQVQLVIGIGDLPLMFISIVFGPIYGAISGVVQDVLGFMISPAPIFHPGFTLNAILMGVMPWLIIKINPFKERVYKIINISLSLLILGSSLYFVFNIEFISKSISDLDQILAYGIVGSMAFSTLVLSIFFMYMKSESKNHLYIFSILMTFIVVSVILTPLWVKQYLLLLDTPIEKSYWILLPPRIIKLPFETMIYSVLLIRLIDVFNNINHKFSRKK
jgi:ECF transporter S component (folate family)